MLLNTLHVCNLASLHFLQNLHLISLAVGWLYAVDPDDDDGRTGVCDKWWWLVLLLVLPLLLLDDLERGLEPGRDLDLDLGFDLDPEWRRVAISLLLDDSDLSAGM